jgi:hypothetical protein
VDHGTFVPIARDTSWSRAEPVVLRGAVRPPDVRASMRIVAGLRAGEDLSHLVAAPRGFRWAGVSQNLRDVLEMQKVQVEPLLRRGGGFGGQAGGIYVKVNWLSTHPGDGSLRLRFSYGAEVLDDWLDEPARARRVLALVERAFPETRLVTRGLRRAVRRVSGVSPRFIQPILYSNAPGGGALFHHDYVPGQVGVVFTQLAGSTAWLTLPKRVLAAHVGAHRGKRMGRLLERMERRDDHLERLLNHTPSFTSRLVADGWLFVLRAGDAIMLPSPGPDDVAWHSVFTVGRGANWALSAGFAADGK